MVEEHTRSYATGASRLEAYTTALEELVADCSSQTRSEVASIAVDGTSATALLCDASDWSVLAGPMLYNEAAPNDAVEAVQRIAPHGHTTCSSTSTLCKLVYWYQRGYLESTSAPLVVHQADWVNALLAGHPLHVTDFNNALKLGCDPALAPSIRPPFPQWLQETEYSCALPSDVVAPGTCIGTVTHDASKWLGLPKDALVCASTTDSNAAFLAAGVNQPGEAVTSLGSTLAVKATSEKRVDDASYGLYSHWLNNAWLVGGASNVGGATLRHFFSDDELAELSNELDPSIPCEYSYYPLPPGTKGERFPINDSSKAPQLDPKPATRAEFLKCLLEGIAHVEKLAYDTLEHLGATPVTRVITSGGGSKNVVWREIRQRVLQRTVDVAQHTEAAYGSAMLAASAIQQT